MWIKINIQCKSYSLDVKNNLRKLSGALLVMFKASDRDAVVRL